MALVQLMATGAQDALLTDNPTTSFFRSWYKRHTPFATEWKDQVFAGETGYGKRCVVKLARLGDLVHSCMLELTMKSTGPTFYPAEACVESVEIWIGGIKFDAHDATFFRVYDELYRTQDAREAYRELADFTTEPIGATKQLFLPLAFWFSRDVSQALPLVALQHHDVELVFTFAARVDGIDMTVDPAPKLVCEYFYLDNVERRLIAQSQQTVLIEQLQQFSTTVDLAAAPTMHFDLPFNHPVKTLIVVLCHPTKHGVFTGSLKGLEPREVYAPLHSVKLLLDGVERSEVRSGPWCRIVDAFARTKQIPSAGIYSMHFCLDPASSTQPSGSLNFSRLSGVLYLLPKRLVPGGTRETILNEAEDTVDDVRLLTVLRVYAQSWNQMAILDGQGGLRWSN